MKKTPLVLNVTFRAKHVQKMGLLIVALLAFRKIFFIKTNAFPNVHKVFLDLKKILVNNVRLFAKRAVWQMSALLVMRKGFYMINSAY